LSSTRRVVSEALDKHSPFRACLFSETSHDWLLTGILVAIFSLGFFRLPLSKSRSLVLEPILFEQLAHSPPIPPPPQTSSSRLFFFFFFFSSQATCLDRLSPSGFSPPSPPPTPVFLLYRSQTRFSSPPFSGRGVVTPPFMRSFLGYSSGPPPPSFLEAGSIIDQRLGLRLQRYKCPKP